MFGKFFNKLKEKSVKKKFREDLKKEQNKMFVGLGNDEKKFKKRIKIAFKIPNIFLYLNKKVLKYLGIVLVIVLVCASYMFINSDYFKVKTINIDYDDNIGELLNFDLIYSAVDSFRNENILFIEKNDIETSIMEYQKNIVSVKVDKKIFGGDGTLNIYLTSSPKNFHTNYNGKEYYITENGVFVPCKKFETGSLSEIILSLRQKEINFYDYRQIIKPKYMEKINDLQKKLVRNLQELEIKKIYFFENEREVHFDINENIKLIFNLEYDLDEQITNIGVFNKENNNILKTNTIVYVDLRIPNKIFYCESSSKGICLNNLSEIYDLYE